VYKIPPKTSQNKPPEESVSDNGPIAKTINQPIAIYNSVEKMTNFLMKNILKIIPMSVNPQTIPKIDQPTAPLKLTRVNGVYVPAIKIKIAE
jgi:hypothetical protein